MQKLLYGKFPQNTINNHSNCTSLKYNERQEIVVSVLCLCYFFLLSLLFVVFVLFYVSYNSSNHCDHLPIIEIVNKLSHNKYNYEHDIHVKEINPKRQANINTQTHTHNKVDHD